MARSSRRFRPGDPQFFGSNGTLPRSGDYFEDEARRSVAASLDAGALVRSVYPSRLSAPGRDRKARVYYPPPLAKHAVGVWPSGRYSAVSLLRLRAPHRVLFCVRRKIRRQVLFAMRKAGFRGSAPKKHYRRSINSQYRC